MSSTLSRRNFLLGMGVGTIAFVSLDLSRVTGLNKAGSRIRFGYAAITWEGNDVQAINDISELGFELEIFASGEYSRMLEREWAET